MHERDISTISRRSVLAGMPGAMMLGLTQRLKGASHLSRPKIAVVLTEYRKYSHAQCVVDRILEGFGWETAHHHPKMDVVSLYVDQFPKSDLSRERVQRHKDLQLYPSIAEALTRGGDTLAVDGVLIIAEHGRYPQNERGQVLYPRFEFFREVVDVFRDSGRSVPVFTDKHLSWKWEWAVEMVETAESLGFPLMAGSSVPVSWRIPSHDLPWKADITEALSIGPGGIDSYDIHVLEGLQSLVERRRGGETGVVSMQAFRGPRVWDLLRAGSWDAGGCDKRLFEACLCRSHTLSPPRETFNHIFPSIEEMAELVNMKPIAYRFQYADGLKATIFLIDGVVNDITAAVRFKNHPEPFSLQFYLGAGHGMQPNFFNPLVRHIETMITTGQIPYPVERTLLTTGLTAAGIESLWQSEAHMDTPHLDIRYQPIQTSAFRAS